MKDKFVKYTKAQAAIDSGFQPCSICTKRGVGLVCPNCSGGYYVKENTTPRKSKDRKLLEAMLEQMTIISGHVYTMHQKGKLTLTPKQVSAMVKIKTKMEKV